jgi:hypothetical protein
MQFQPTMFHSSGDIIPVASFTCKKLCPKPSSESEEGLTSLPSASSRRKKALAGCQRDVGCVGVWQRCCKEVGVQEIIDEIFLYIVAVVIKISHR